MTDEIIIADTINVGPVSGGICTVSASVMGADDSREEAISVSYRWNTSAGSAVAQAGLIAAYTSAQNKPEDALKATLIADIGTVIPE